MVGHYVLIVYRQDETGKPIREKGEGKMSELSQWCKEHKVKVSPQVKRASDFLESKGYDFCVDFGYDNAEQKAKDLYGFKAADPDRKTLNGMVLSLMRNHGWWSPWHLQESIKTKHFVYVCDSSVKSRIRDLRLPEYGCHLIEKRRIVDSNAFEYMLKR